MIKHYLSPINIEMNTFHMQPNRQLKLFYKILMPAMLFVASNIFFRYILMSLTLLNLKTCHSPCEYRFFWFLPLTRLSSLFKWWYKWWLGVGSLKCQIHGVRECCVQGRSDICVSLLRRCLICNITPSFSVSLGVACLDMLQWRWCHHIQSTQCRTLIADRQLK